MYWPKISIVTPSYNQGNFLEETIQSVLDQGYPNLEYIVVDGGSTDNSVEIIKRYSDRLAYWISEKDTGQANAINKGFRRCTGEIVAWLNSDDIYVPGTLTLVAELLNDNPAIGMLYGDAEIINENGVFIKHKKELPYDRIMGCLIGWGFIISQPTAFIRKVVFDRIGYLNEDYIYALDAEFWMRISRVFHIKHFSKAFARVRYHTGSKTIKDLEENPRCRNEIEMVLKESYTQLRISKWLPYRYAFLIQFIYRFKRIFLRFLKGHYFGGYVPESIVRRTFSSKTRGFLKEKHDEIDLT